MHTGQGVRLGRAVLVVIGLVGLCSIALAVAWSPAGLLLAFSASPIIAVAAAGGLVGSAVLAVRRRGAALTATPPTAGSRRGASGPSARWSVRLHALLLVNAVPLVVLVAASAGTVRLGDGLFVLLPAGVVALAAAPTSVVLTWRQALDGRRIRAEAFAAARSAAVRARMRAGRAVVAASLVLHVAAAVVLLVPSAGSALLLPSS